MKPPITVESPPSNIELFLPPSMVCPIRSPLANPRDEESKMRFPRPPIIVESWIDWWSDEDIILLDPPKILLTEKLELSNGAITF